MAGKEKLTQLMYETLKREFEPLGFLIEQNDDHSQIHIFDVSVDPAKLSVVAVVAEVTGPFLTR